MLLLLFFTLKVTIFFCNREISPLIFIYITISIAYIHILCLARDVHLGTKICLSGVQAIATRWATHCTLGVDVHRTSRLGLANSAVVTSDTVLGMCATMATVDGVV